MFANVTIFTDTEAAAPAVPRDSLIYEGSSVRLWIAHDDKSIELRQIKTGRVDGRMVEVIDGVQPGERVITKGSLFIDRIATTGT
jgi:cobalt-zinc-cadmium efflux system membrane fusion protein